MTDEEAGFTGLLRDIGDGRGPGPRPLLLLSCGRHSPLLTVPLIRAQIVKSTVTRQRHPAVPGRRVCGGRSILPGTQLPREVHSQLRPELEQQVGASADVSVLERRAGDVLLVRGGAAGIEDSSGGGVSCMALPQQAKTPRVAKWA